MKGKLIKTDVNYLLEDDKGVVVASTSTKEGINGLTKQNCDEIFGVVDVVYKQARNGFDGVIDSFTEAFAKECINKAMELNKDKVFTREDMIWARDSGYTNFMTEEMFFDKLDMHNQQPTEIDVEIEMEKVVDETKIIGAVKGVKGSGDKITTYKSVPKFDENGCLILIRLI
jgi:hypothetical protein